jgi:hypothetical protein
MGLLKSLADALSGKTLHWNNTNNAVVSELWGRLPEVSPQLGEFFKAAIVGAGSVVERLFFPKSLARPILSSDLRRLDKRDFEEIYKAALWLLAFKLHRANPQLSDVIAADLSMILGGEPGPGTIAEAFSLLLQCEEASPGSAALQGWKRICEVSRQSADDAGQQYDFAEYSSRIFLMAARTAGACTGSTSLKCHPN